MAFRNPTHTLPASAIRGQIGSGQIKDGAVTFGKIAADAINGKTITGAIIQTAATGPRVKLDAAHLSVLGSSGNQLAEINPGDTYGRAAFASYSKVGAKTFYSALTAGELRFGISGVTDPTTEAYIAFSDLGGGSSPYELLLSSGNKANASSADIIMYSETSPTGDNARVDILADAVDVGGKFTAKNIRCGRVTITPTPNVPTSATVTGLALAGAPRAVVSPSTSVPGTSVLGTGYSGLTTDSITVWLTRVNNGATNVDYVVIGE